MTERQSTTESPSARPFLTRREAAMRYGIVGAEQLPIWKRKGYPLPPGIRVAIRVGDEVHEAKSFEHRHADVSTRLGLMGEDGEDGFTVDPPGDRDFMPKPKPSHILALSAEDAADQALNTAVEWARGYGRIKAIAEALSTATGQPVTRQLVGRWLNPDRAKRVQTNLGMGLMLLHVVGMLRATTEGELGEPQAARESAFVSVDLFAPEPKKRTTKKIK